MVMIYTLIKRESENLKVQNFGRGKSVGQDDHYFRHT